MTTSTKYINRLMLTILMVISVALVLGIYLYAFHENPAMVIKNSPVPTDKTTYHIGDEIFATFDYCRYSLAPATRYVTFSDGLLHSIPTITIPGPGIGCFVIAGNIATVPPSLPPGRYHIVGRHVLEVNFLATRYVEWQTTEFDVLP